MLIYELGVRLAPLVFDTSKSSLHWGITVRYSVILFGILSLFLSIIYEYSKSRSGYYFTLLVACLLFCGYYFTDLKYTPFRTTLLMFSGVTGFVVPLIIKWKYFKLK
jgi:hypothetical protein